VSCARPLQYGEDRRAESRALELAGARRSTKSLGTTNPINKVRAAEQGRRSRRHLRYRRARARPFEDRGKAPLGGTESEAAMRLCTGGEDAMLTSLRSRADQP
jgi:hypothetical protein